VTHEGSGRLHLLRRASEFRLLFFATLGSSVGTYLAAVALTIDIYDRTESGWWVAGLLLADFLPIIVIGLTLGPLVDRLSRRMLMITSDVARLAVFAALPFVDSPAAIVGLAGVAGIATGFFRPAVYAGLPNLVEDDDLASANGILAGAENLGWMVAPVIGGVLVAASGPSAAYWINAVTFLVSAVLVARIPGTKLQSEESLSQGHWRDVGEGLAFVRGSLALLTVLIVWNAAMIATAFVNVSEIFLAKESFSAGNVGYGILVAATGLGLTVGSFLSPRVLATRGLRVTYIGSIVVMGVGIGAASLAPNVWVAAVLIAFGTLGNAGAIVCNQLLVQRGAPDRLRGRALAVLLSSFYLTQGVGMVLGGPLADMLGGRAMFAVAGVLYLLTSLVAVAMTSRLRSAAIATPVPEPGSVESLFAEDGEQGPRGIDRIALLLEEIDATRRAESRRSA
jgi:MFS family permease